MVNSPALASESALRKDSLGLMFEQEQHLLKKAVEFCGGDELAGQHLFDDFFENLSSDTVGQILEIPPVNRHDLNLRHGGGVTRYLIDFAEKKKRDQSGDRVSAFSSSKEKPSGRLGKAILVLGMGALAASQMTERGREVAAGTVANFKEGVNRVLYGDPVDEHFSPAEEIIAGAEQPVFVEPEGDGIDYEAIQANIDAQMAEQEASFEAAHKPLGTYEVQEGDTLYSIVKESYGQEIDETLAQELFLLLGISSDKLSIGQKLELPSPFSVHEALYGLPGDE